MVRVTLKQVAEEAGVSIQTVSNILGNRTQQTWASTRKRAKKVRDIADRLGYRPNAAARAMRSKRSMQIGVLLRNDPHRPVPYLASFEMVLGINARLEPADYVLSLVRYEEVAGERAPASRVFHEHMLDGMILLGQFPDEVHEHVQEMTPQCVWLEANVWRKEHCIRRDEQHAGTLVGEHLAGLGYQRVVWVGASPTDETAHFSVGQRYRAIEAVCRRRGMALSNLQQTHPPTMVERAMNLQGVLRQDVAMVAYNTQTAIALTQQAGAMGLNAGRDYGLVCCDDDQITLRAWPGLSRVSNDRFRLGRQAAEMMLHTLEQGDAPCPSRLMPDEWIAGNTARGPGGFSGGGGATKAT